jgi:centromere protein S
LESFHYFVGKEATKIANSLNIEIGPLYIEALAKVLLYQTKYLSLDLEAFCKHGKRSGINMDDLKLCLRRNPSLHRILTINMENSHK